MSTTYAVLINELVRKTPAMSRTTGVTLLQRSFNDIIAEFGMTRDEQIISLVAGTPRYAFDTNVLRIWQAELQYGLSEAPKLKLKSIRDYDRNESPVSRLRATGTPSELYLDPSSTGARQVGVYPVPTLSSLVVSGATNATPIVITTTTDHGLSDGSPVFVAGVTGNLAANGANYAKVTGYSDTTFGLYSDSDLSTAVAGTGAYVSGGVVGVSANPFLRLIVSRRITVSDGSGTIPESFDDYIDVLLFGAWRQWLERRGTQQEVEAMNVKYERKKTELRRRVQGVLANVEPVSRPYLRKRFTTR